MKKAVEITVRGRVQGVGYRYFALRTARALGIRGFVRNEPDGKSVFIYAEGSPSAVEQFLEKIKEGPPAAIVENVEVTEVTPVEEWEDFRITFA